MNSVLLSVVLAFTPVDSVNTNDSTLSTNVTGTHKGKIRIGYDSKLAGTHKGKVRIGYDSKLVGTHKGKIRI